jgi:hypothetical protein
MSGLPCCRKPFLFAGLSLIDLTLTWIILWRAEGFACESNPVAAWWLDRFGWPGLAGFKVAIVLLVVTLTSVVSRHHPRAGTRLLTFGCCALLAVVQYSAALVLRAEAEADSAAAAKIRYCRGSMRDVERVLVRKRAYDRLLVRLTEDLAEHRRSLVEAVAALAQAEHVKDPRWLRRMQSNHHCSGMDECLAYKLVFSTLVLLETDRHRLEQVYRDLDAQFRSRFGRPAPWRPGGPGQPPVESVLGEMGAF